MIPTDQTRRYYDATADREDQRLIGRQLERDVVLDRLSDHLPPAAKILEIGAGSGHYSAALLAEGHHVTAVDISPRLVAMCAARCAATGASDWIAVAADARTLLGIGGGYDAALIMGPLYHLPDKAGRQAALEAARRRLAPGGLIFSTWINRFGILGQLLAMTPDWIDDSEAVGRLFDTGHFSDSSNWFCTDIESVVPFHEQAGFETVRFCPLDPGIFGTDEAYNSLYGYRRRRWRAALLRLAEEPTMIAYSRHLLYVGRKA